MKYSPIFKFCPDPGIFFTSVFCYSDFGTGSSVFFLENDRWEFWYEKNWEDELARQGLDFFLDKTKFKAYKNDILSTADVLADSWSEFLSSELPSMSKEEFSSSFESISQQFSKFFSLYHYTEFYFYDSIDRKIKEAVEQADKESANDNLDVLLRHSKGQNEFFESKFAKYNKLLNNIENTEKNFSKDSVDGEDQKAMETKLGLSEEIIQLLCVVREMQGIKYFFRLFLNKAFFGEDSVRHYLEKETARRLKVDLSVVELMFINEVKDALANESFDEKQIKQRENLYAIKMKDHRYEIFTGEDVRPIIAEVKKLDSQEIKGMVANRGQAQGRAKVIKLTTKLELLAQSIELMDEGQILVADTTGPELIMACKKAAAIVTNEGGITSHAAIVSRELNIPCIIGTKHATDIIKDGDMLKVDAMTGVVEIL